MKRIIFLILLLVFLCFVFLERVYSLPKYSRQTNKTCSYCHLRPNGGGGLTLEGQNFLGNNHLLPDATPTPTPTATTQAEGTILIGAAIFKYDGLGKSKLSCASCHPNGGSIGKTSAGEEIPALYDVVNKKEWRKGKSPTLEEAVNHSIMKYIEGEPMSKHSLEMKSLRLYLETLKTK